MLETRPRERSFAQIGWTIFGLAIAVLVVLPFGMLYWSVREPSPDRLRMSVDDLQPWTDAVTELQRWDGYDCPGAGDAIPCAETASILLDPGDHTVSELAGIIEGRLVTEGWDSKSAYWGSAALWLRATKTYVGFGSLADYLGPVLGPSLNQEISDDGLDRYPSPEGLLVIQMTAGPD